MHQNEDDLPDIEFEFDTEGMTYTGTITGVPTINGNAAPNWPFPTGGSGITWTTTGSANSPGIIIPSSVTPKLNLMPPTPKTSVVYVVVFDDGSTLQLQEQSIITPREMINIAKFINMVTNYCVAGIAGQSFDVKWSDLVMSLKIDKHFVSGPRHANYDTSTDVLYVFLMDK
jgi:hypothetical protein